MKSLNAFAMKSFYFITSCFLIACCSCSTSNKTTQTNSDDMYYSNGRSGGTVNASATQQGDYYTANPNDQYLMMRVQNPALWSTFDNYDYGYAGTYYPFGYAPYGLYGGFSPWISFGYWNPYYTYFNGYYAWNSFYNPYFYNPYYGGVVVVNNHYPAFNTYSQLHPFALTRYTSTAIGNANRFKSATTHNNFNRSFQNNSNTRQSNFQSRSFTPSSFGGGSRSFGRGR